MLQHYNILLMLNYSIKITIPYNLLRYSVQYTILHLYFITIFIYYTTYIHYTILIYYTTLHYIYSLHYIHILHYTIFIYYTTLYSLHYIHILHYTIFIYYTTLYSLHYIHILHYTIFIYIYHYTTEPTLYYTAPILYFTYLAILLATAISSVLPVSLPATKSNSSCADNSLPPAAGTISTVFSTILV